MNKRKWLDSLKYDRAKSLPILSFPMTKKYNISVNELVNSQNLQAELMCKIAQEYPMSAVLSMMDLSVEAEAFGAPIRFIKDDVPTVTKAIIESIEDVDNLKIPEVFKNRTGVYVEGIRLAKKNAFGKPVIAGVIGPFSLAGRLMDMTEIMINTYYNPNLVKMLLNKTTEFIIKYITAFKEAGANGIMIAEPAAGLLSPEICEEFSSCYIKKIIESLETENFVIIYHNCGNVIPLVNTILTFDADIYHFGDSIDLEDMLKLMPKDKIIMGNISPSNVIKNSSSKEVYESIINLLNKCDKYENFVISTGCDVPYLAPLQNIETYFESIKDFYKK
ncbi:MAG: uroporphyrinogen decarboxylase family protein [Candidatus Izemoplasmatales bacterium]